MVLKRLTKTNLAASRAALMTAYATAATQQEAQLVEVEMPFTESIVREDIARGRIQVPIDDMYLILRGRFERPPRPFPDPAKEADAAERWIKMGRSPSSAFAEVGMNYEQEITQSAQDQRFANAQGVGLNPDPETVMAKDAAFVDRVAAIQAKIDVVEVDGLVWPMVIGAQAAVTAPGAFITAALVAPSPEPAPTTEPAPTATDQDQEDQADEGMQQ